MARQVFFGYLLIKWSPTELCPSGKYKAEHIQNCAASCEAKWIRTFLAEIVFHMCKQTCILCDNKIVDSSIVVNSWANNAERTKSENSWYLKNHFVKHSAQSGQIEVNYVESNWNESNGFTKPLDQQKCKEFKDMICLQSSNLAAQFARGFRPRHKFSVTVPGSGYTVRTTIITKPPFRSVS